MLSTMVRWGKRPACWITYPMRRRRRAGSIPAVDSPSSEIVPDVGSISLLIMRSEVVLPQPEGPTNAVIFPVRAFQIESIDRNGSVWIRLGDLVEFDHLRTTFIVDLSPDAPRRNGRVPFEHTPTCDSVHLLTGRAVEKKVHGGTQICTRVAGLRSSSSSTKTRTREVRAELGRRIQLTLLLRECANCRDQFTRQHHL